MSDFDKRNKPTPYAAYPANAQTLDGEGASGFTRVEPWITVERMKDEFLFGIPLKSFYTKQELKDEVIKQIILKAAGRVELECQTPIFPTVIVKRLDFDRTKYMQGFCQMNLGVRNIRNLLELSIRTTNSLTTYDGISQVPAGATNEGNVIYSVPLEWVDMTYARKGILALVPLQTTYNSMTPGGSYMGAAAALFACWSRLEFIPGFWYLKASVGFEENAIPTIINDLIGTYAAMEILSTLAPLNRFNSQSVNLDGAGQSVSGSGIGIYAQRYAELEKKADKLQDAINAHFRTKISMTHI